ncbi:PREDICTED: zinc finger MYM-type protein 1-like [Ipomoea nil]|uniref:zinc finger MYM-type protein 1-like n=1 Tax=Ipomoea nil TaxID=35883 RepID=UPI0009012C4B|nr:PREDICTED: zinc finger MYM-type protein 1-like [Ipomoea nil]
MGPCQPKNHVFPTRVITGANRRFNPKWFEDHSNWLEYSVSEDATYCLCCYLFKDESSGQQAGGESFVTEGFNNWKKGPERLRAHVGNHNSVHARNVQACRDLMTQEQHLQVCVSKHSEQSKQDYCVRLTSSVKCIRLLLRQGLAFRGNDESYDSLNRGNFLKVLKFLADNNEDVAKVVMRNAPENHQMTSPCIQKDIVNAIASETTEMIINDLGGELFAIIVDESRDISVKEQMIVFIRYVDSSGHIIERLLGITHVRDTTSMSLKVAVEDLLTRHGLSISRIRGQGYDGASNMRGEFNGLRTLIQNENPSAFYVHCFAHQLQLALVGVAKENNDVGDFFVTVSQLCNIVCASCKRRDSLRDKQLKMLIDSISADTIETGIGLNQEAVLQRPGDTRWGSHYGALVSILKLFSPVIDVLDEIIQDPKQRLEAFRVLKNVLCFDFVFFLHLMKDVLGITNDLSQALQKKDQNIVNAMRLVDVSKQRLQMMRDDGWEALLQEVSLFCNKHAIPIPNMDEVYVVPGRPRRNVEERTHLHRYRVERFCVDLDLQLQELNNRFNEKNTELLLCVACFDPRDPFAMFDKDKLIRLAQFYPNDFSDIELEVLDNQLQTYFIDVSSDPAFSKLGGIDELAQKMVETRRHLDYTFVYLLLKLSLILPVATASVERAFSAMKLIKTSLRNRMSDDLLHDCLVPYVEKDIFDLVSNEAILQRFQNMRERRGVLPRSLS